MAAWRQPLLRFWKGKKDLSKSRGHSSLMQLNLAESTACAKFQGREEYGFEKPCNDLDGQP
jgi:hypothetical protein